ncbi:MAG: hypothetical protein IKO47_08665 [Ruminococcus sp.]|nr:hypothetical protein [Ruminococcus sp.]
MQILNDTLFLADVIAIAVMMHIIARCIADDSEKRRQKRRDEGYQRHKARLKKERIMGENRIELWRRYAR